MLKYCLHFFCFVFFFVLVVLCEKKLFPSYTKVFSHSHLFRLFYYAFVYFSSLFFVFIFRLKKFKRCHQYFLSSYTNTKFTLHIALHTVIWVVQMIQLQTHRIVSHTTQVTYSPYIHLCFVYVYIWGDCFYFSLPIHFCLLLFSCKLCTNLVFSFIKCVLCVYVRMRMRLFVCFKDQYLFLFYSFKTF